MRSAVPSWMSGYQREWLRSDLIGGLTVAALLVPEGMAYAQLAGVPPEAAFYAAPIGLVLYALLGSSRQLVVAVSGAVAVLSASIVGRIADPGSEEFVIATAALAIFTGAIAFACGLLKLGKIAQFFSESVLTGFVFGLALVIMIKQVPKMLGLEGEEGNFFERLWDVVRNLGDANSTSVVIGGATLVLMFLLERYFERIPAALVALVGGIIVGDVFDVADEDVEILGDVPAGLAGPTIPDIEAADIGMLVIGGLAITLVAFAEAVGPARQFASEHGYKIDDNRELIGIGGANVGAGLFQGFSIGSSLSKSAANDRAGAETPLSLIVAALVTGAVALWFTGLLETLPEPTLGAIVVVAVSGMLKVPEMKRYWSVAKRDFLFGATALIGVLVFDTLPGLGIAVLVSFGALIWRAASPEVSELGRRRGGTEFVSLADDPSAHDVQGALMLRPEETLFFANAASVTASIIERVEETDPRPTVVIVDLSATVDIDTPACDELLEMVHELQKIDVAVALVRVRPPVRAMFDRTAVTDAIGPERIFSSNRIAIAAYASAGERTPDPAEVAREAANGLREIDALIASPEVSDRLRTAIDDLDPPDE